MIPLDLDLAASGYLRSPDGHIRHVWGLDQIAADLVRAGARVLWDDELRWPGYAYCWQRVILLHPSLAAAPPWWVRRALVHELSHLVLGTESEERVRAWQRVYYADLCLPPDW